MFAKDDNGTPRILTDKKIIGPNGEQASRQILDLWTAAELKAWNIYPVTEDAVPEGKREVSRSLVRIGDTVNIAKVLEDIPGAVRQVVGVDGVVRSVFVGVPSVPFVEPDVFPDPALAVGGTYDAKDKRYEKLDKNVMIVFRQVFNDVLELKPVDPAIVFPSNPVNNQEFINAGITWTWKTARAKWLPKYTAAQFKVFVKAMMT